MWGQDSSSQSDGKTLPNFPWGQMRWLHMWFPVWTSACMPPSKERHPNVSKAIVEAEGRSNVTKLDAELQPTK